MPSITGSMPINATALSSVSSANKDSRKVLVAAAGSSLWRAVSNTSRTCSLKALVLKSMVPIFGFASLFGCQSAQEQASASVVATVPTAQAEAPKVVVPDNAGTPSTIPIQKVTTADSDISDRVVVAAKAAFEKNKCGVCHSVGAFAAAKAPATKRELSGVGLIRSCAWIAGFLQKKEKIDGKSHMKLFGGSDAELAALSEWLASQKTVPVPAKTSGTN